MIVKQFSRFNGREGVVLNVLRSHLDFLQKNTGVTNDARKQHYVFNPEMVLSNNRHFIAATRMEAQPNGDATTEGQSLQIIGVALAYIATKEPRWLEMAEQCFEAYCKYFYREEENPMPNPPGAWYCNWIVNGKEPVVSHYPIDGEWPTHGGFKGVTVEFENGLTLIPHDSPTWGQYLDLATFAFEGALAWDAINARVQALKDDGTPDWDNKGEQYNVDWIITWEGTKIDSNGDAELDADGNPVIYPDEEKGTVQLKDTSVTGEYKLNYAVRLPVEDGGRLIGRNETQHNRPVHVPVTPKQMGNAADAEEWMGDAAYILWKITGKQRYWNVWQCVLETCSKYSDIDMTDRFFRQTRESTTPWTDGISYDWTYPSGANVTYGRDEEGYITVTTDSDTKVTIEAQSIWFKLDENSELVINVGGVDEDGGKITFTPTLTTSPEKSEDKSKMRTWCAPALTTTSNEVQTLRVRMCDLIAETNTETGEDYIVADERISATWGKADVSYIIEENVLDGRTVNVLDFYLPPDNSANGWAGAEIGMWLTDLGYCTLSSITYRSNGVVYAEAEAEMEATEEGAEPETVIHKFTLENTNGKWVTKTIGPFERVGAISFSTNAVVQFGLYCVNDVPPRLSDFPAYTMYFNLTVAADAAYTARIGDCTIDKYAGGNLAYTPGVIPFSNNPLPDAPLFDSWRGLPYPGYQYPFIYCYERKAGEWETHLNNMVEFLYDSQKWYYEEFGELGPGASAYIWKRWDNLSYGDPDTWTMEHWGETAWSGYQPRAYCGAARAWYELVIQDKPVPPHLIEYVNNWTKWLAEFASKHSGHTPAVFPVDSLPTWEEGDFTGHMTGLWLAGACYSKLAGCTLTEVDEVIDASIGELFDELVIKDPDEIMNGSWSPAVRSNSGKGEESNGMFFGFWSGEILRGFALYLISRTIHPKESMYENF